MTVIRSLYQPSFLVHGERDLSTPTASMGILQGYLLKKTYTHTHTLPQSCKINNVNS